MTDPEILKKAISKAVDNGFLINGDLLDWYILDDVQTILCTWKDAYTLGHVYISTNDIIFSNSFAKCFWGERRVCENEGHPIKKCICSTEFGGIVTFPAWQYHLQQLVLAEDRLAYLEKFI